jgi:hypothetical protein
MQQAVDHLRYQRTANLLGYLGLLPFAGLTLLLFADVHPALVVDALRFYAATILVFVGAIHWGTSLYSGNVADALVSVAVALYAWLCLMFGEVTSLLGLTAGFVGIYIHDRDRYRDLMPWFVKLRRNLTLVVSTSLMISVGWLVFRSDAI